MKINVYRNSYFDDNSKQKEEYDEELRREYEDEFEENDYSSYNIAQDDIETDEEDLPKAKPPKKKKKKLRFIWRLLIKLSAVLLALSIVVLMVGYVFSFFTPPVTNVLVMATDEDGTRTDTLMLVSFAKKSKDKLIF